MQRLRSTAPKLIKLRVSKSRTSLISRSSGESVVKLGEWFTCISNIVEYGLGFHQSQLGGIDEKRGGEQGWLMPNGPEGSEQGQIITYAS